MKNIKNIQNIKILNPESIIFFLAFLGILVSGYLLYLYQQPTEIICMSNCQQVRESEYSSFLGIDLPIWGLLYYLGIFAYILIKFPFKKEFLLFSLEKYLFLLYTTLGFSFSIYLTYIEAFILGLFCDWCLASALIASLIFLINLIYTIKNSKNNKN